MSLLEDVFLEDEAGEAQELERVIEGDEYDERPHLESGGESDNNSEKEDEAVEDKRRVDPASTKTRRVVKNPRFILNPARLIGPRGIQVIPDHFKDFKFKGKGHEKEDLDLVLKKLEHWAYRLYPKFKFEDCLKKIETLGKKRPVMVHLHKIRLDQFTSEETVVQKDSSDEETAAPPEEDEFDKLLQQQIELARSTPVPDSSKKPAFRTPQTESRALMAPKAMSSPSISDEQKERMLRNRKLAEERRLARLQNSDNDARNTVINKMPIVIEDCVETGSKYEQRPKKHNRSNVIDSSDDECEEVAVNQSITVDVHTVTNDVDIDRVVNDNHKSIDIDNDSDDITEDIAENIPIPHQYDISEKNSEESVSVENIVSDRNNELSNSDCVYDNVQEINSFVEENNGSYKLAGKDIKNTDFVDVDADLENYTNDNTGSITVATGNHYNDQNNHITDECNDINKSVTEGTHIIKESVICTKTPDSAVILNKMVDLQTDKENVDNNIELDLMDVDFSEAF